LAGFCPAEEADALHLGAVHQGEGLVRAALALLLRAALRAACWRQAGQFPAATAVARPRLAGSDALESSRQTAPLRERQWKQRQQAVQSV
jgi:hypothetical protein